MISILSACMLVYAFERAVSKDSQISGHNRDRHAFDFDFVLPFVVDIRIGLVVRAAVVQVCA
jgi:hypothetical protein